MFCGSCGKQNREGVRFCPSCGEAVLQRKLKRCVPAILLGLLLAFFALSQIALWVIGTNTTGIVTGYERRLQVRPGQDDGNTLDPMRYEVFYRFTAPDGKEYSGSVSKSFPREVRVPSDGAPQTIAVRYLPMMPHINTPDGNTSILPVILLLGLAALLFMLGG